LHEIHHKLQLEKTVEESGVNRPTKSLPGRCGNLEQQPESDPKRNDSQGADDAENEQDATARHLQERVTRYGERTVHDFWSVMNEGS
jgi:hypothetical protein